MYNKHNIQTADLKLLILNSYKLKSDTIISKFEQPSLQQQLSTISKADSNLMELRVCNDKKMSEIVGSISGAVMQVCGIQVALKFLVSIGVLILDVDRLEVFMKNERTSDVNLRRDELFKSKFEVFNNLSNVRDIIGYEFEDKMLLMQAFSYKSYVDNIWFTEKVKLKDYNLIEFLGDSILNFFVLKFFYINSNKFKDDYPGNALHRLRSEIVNNNFLSLPMIENDLHKFILKNEQMSFNDKFSTYVTQIKGKTKGQFATKMIFKKYFQNVQDFMDPVIMSKMAIETDDVRLDLEDTQNSCQKVFGDVLEALIAAVFIDSGGDLDQTHAVFMRLMEPYLYVYGNTFTTLGHPHTQIIDLWMKESFANIRDHSIKISHLNEVDSEREQIIYRGFLGEVDVISESYHINEKNKKRSFYKKFKGLVETLVLEIKSLHPGIDSVVKRVNKAEPYNVQVQRDKLGIGNDAFEQLKYPNQVHCWLIDIIKRLSRIWNDSQK